MKTNSFKNRLLQIQRIRNLKWIDIARRSGLDKAQISQYKNGVHEPEQDALYKLATALNVNVTWLMGHDVPMEVNNNLNKQIEDTYGDTALKLLNLFAMLNDAGQQEILEKASKLTSFKLYTE